MSLTYEDFVIGTTSLGDKVAFSVELKRDIPLPGVNLRSDVTRSEDA